MLDDESDGRDEHALSRGLGNFLSGVRWMPDGRVLYVALAPEPTPYTVGADGGDVRRFSRDLVFNQMAIAPMGNASPSPAETSPAATSGPRTSTARIRNRSRAPATLTVRNGVPTAALSSTWRWDGSRRFGAWRWMVASPFASRIGRRTNLFRLPMGCGFFAASARPKLIRSSFGKRHSFAPTERASRATSLFRTRKPVGAGFPAAASSGSWPAMRGPRTSGPRTYAAGRRASSRILIRAPSRRSTSPATDES